jgi:DNA-binding NtrC family response regulator
MPSPRRLKLLTILQRNGMETAAAGDFRDGHLKLQEQPFDLLFVDAELPGGPWQRLVPAVVASGKDCEVIVCSRCGDERLWAEVLQCGAYDLIAEPFEEGEVARIARCALDSHYLQRYGPAARRPDSKAKAS